jgi:hypothetical protein
VVPHAQILRAISLAAHSSLRPAERIHELKTQFHVEYPCPEAIFWKAEVLEYLPVEIRVPLETTCAEFTRNYDYLFRAATGLELNDVLTVSAEGPTVRLGDPLDSWRSHDGMRFALDALLLCKVSPGGIKDDFRQLYGRTALEQDVLKYAKYFVDKEYLDAWALYSKCLPAAVATEYRRMTAEPIDFVRYKLGIPVALDSEMVLNRLMSEAYFTERLIKHERRDASDLSALPSLSPKDLQRIKLERETVFKCMDRLLKLKEQGHGTERADATKELDALVIELKNHDFEMRENIITTEDLENADGADVGAGATPSPS